MQIVKAFVQRLNGDLKVSSRRHDLLRKPLYTVPDHALKIARTDRRYATAAIDLGLTRYSFRGAFAASTSASDTS